MLPNTSGNYPKGVSHAKPSYFEPVDVAMFSPPCFGRRWKGLCGHVLFDQPKADPLEQYQ